MSGEFLLCMSTAGSRLGLSDVIGTTVAESAILGRHSRMTQSRSTRIEAPAKTHGFVVPLDKTVTIIPALFMFDGHLRLVRF